MSFKSSNRSSRSKGPSCRLGTDASLLLSSDAVGVFAGGFFRDAQSAWVTCPNSLYDPELGHPLYNRYLDELELADQLGFDGVCVNEHHQTAYGGMPSPNIMAACLGAAPSRRSW
jgi:Coenzyme F420-dependent N5,N10-methylene tetrahydromethanopterin reductase and related flavin-dependent oxidoreductases